MIQKRRRVLWAKAHLKSGKMFYGQTSPNLTFLFRTCSGPEMGQSQCPLWKRPSRGCTSFASWGSSTCHRSCWNSSTHWIRPLHVNNCLVQLSYQIWPQKATEGSPDCWANHWYNPPHSPRTVLIQSEQKGWQNHSGPLTSSTLPLWTVAVWSTLQSSEHQNDQTQEQFLPPSNPSHEHLTLNVEHTTLFTLFIHHTYLFFISILHISDLYTHNCLYYILCFCYFVYCQFVYLYIILYYLCPVLLLSFFCTVELLSL